MAGQGCITGDFPATFRAAPSVTSPRAVQALADPLRLTENLVLKQASSPPTEWLSHYPTQQWYQIFFVHFPEDPNIVTLS